MDGITSNRHYLIPAIITGLFLVIFAVGLYRGVTSSQNPPHSTAPHVSIAPPVKHYFRHDPVGKLACGYVLSPIIWSKGVGTQRFRHCYARVRVSLIAFPGPKPHPTAIPVPTSAPSPTYRPTSVTRDYTNDCSSGIHCDLYILQLVNAERASHGYRPLSLSSTISNGEPGCIGSLGHSQSMAARGNIGHWDFPADDCGYGTIYQHAGENVGLSAYGAEKADIDSIQQQMLAEPYSIGCSGNHHCQENDPNMRVIGIAIVPGTYSGLPAHYETQDYAG